LQLGFYARLTSGHGAYHVEVLLQDKSGAVVWREGPPEAWPMSEPLPRSTRGAGITGEGSCVMRSA
jgi:hypothetical protein